MFTKNIRFRNFDFKPDAKRIKKDLFKLIQNKNEILNSFSTKYTYSFSKKIIDKYKNFSNFRLIGMGGSILGAEAIYSFLKDKIRKNFYFINNIKSEKIQNDKKKFLNIIISKSGNTLETISNSNILIKKSEKSIFITENKNSYLRTLAQKLKADIINHNNFIGGRYSVLSEVGMLPMQLAGLNPKKFKQFNYLVKNKNFTNNLADNVANIIHLIKKKNIHH